MISPSYRTYTQKYDSTWFPVTIVEINSFTTRVAISSEFSACKDYYLKFVQNENQWPQLKSTQFYIIMAIVASHSRRSDNCAKCNPREYLSAVFYLINLSYSKKKITLRATTCQR